MGTATLEHYQEKNERYYASDRPDMRAKIPAGARRLLDVGCGRGEFGRMVKQERPGAYVAGLELTQWAVEARQHLDAVYQADAERVDAATIGAFDCISFNDVLEHLFDPVRVVRNLAGALEPGGVMIASSPNVETGGLAAAQMTGKFRVLNAVCGGALDDMRYPQIYVIVRKPR